MYVWMWSSGYECIQNVAEITTRCKRMETIKKDLKFIEYNLVPSIKAYYGYDILDSFLDVLNQYKYDKIFFISEEFIYNLHGKDFVDNLDAHNVNH